MTRRLVPLSLLLGLGALATALVAIFFQPIQDIFLQASSKSGIQLPFRLSSPIIEILDAERQVRYVGRRAASGVEHFQNIFYAEDTSGQNRFAPPIPTKSVEGSFIDATLPGAWCPQGTGDILPFTSRVTNVSENCLSLRIARPRGTQSNANLPVMVWLHGGKC